MTLLLLLLLLLVLFLLLLSCLLLLLLSLYCSCSSRSCAFCYGRFFVLSVIVVSELFCCSVAFVGSVGSF